MSKRRWILILIGISVVAGAILFDPFIALGGQPQQKGYVYVEERTTTFNIAPRGQENFQRHLKSGYLVQIDWEADATIEFFVLNPQWDGRLPPLREDFLAVEEGTVMEGGRFKPNTDGIWTFMFYNDSPEVRSVTLHFVIFVDPKIEPIVDIHSIELPSSSSGGEKFVIAIIGFVAIVFIAWIIAPSEKGMTKQQKQRANSKNRWKNRK